ncbi:MAG: arginine--tRNA ligase, partial [Deltaproteobacteria bacterium CG17_big_fil_post_rev_8_21_14_2_50_63_7]
MAARLAAQIQPNAWLEAVGSAGPYLNLTYRLSSLAQVVVREAIERGAAFGGAQVEPQHVVIEFSAPNTNKPQHLGHVRNNVLGESVSRCLAHWGHRVTRVNLVNDRGIHICKSMLAYQLWGDGCSPESLGQKG